VNGSRRRLAVVRVGAPDSVAGDVRLADLLERIKGGGQRADAVIAVPDDMTLVARAVRRVRLDRADTIVVLGDADPSERTVGGVALAVDLLCDGAQPPRPVGARPLGTGGRSFRLDPAPDTVLVILGDPADFDDGAPAR
jgi:hypothetical protein